VEVLQRLLYIDLRRCGDITKSLNFDALKPIVILLLNHKYIKLQFTGHVHPSKYFSLFFIRVRCVGYEHRAVVYYFFNIQVIFLNLNNFVIFIFENFCDHEIEQLIN